jgi:hypothetical protein
MARPAHARTAFRISGAPASRGALSRRCMTSKGGTRKNSRSRIKGQAQNAAESLLFL